jgi:hypothetical protein
VAEVKPAIMIIPIVMNSVRKIQMKIVIPTLMVSPFILGAENQSGTGTCKRLPIGAKIRVQSCAGGKFWTFDLGSSDNPANARQSGKVLGGTAQWRPPGRGPPADFHPHPIFTDSSSGL